MSNEVKRKKEFFEQFIYAIEEKGNREGSRQAPFLKEVLTYINDTNEPSVFDVPYLKKAEKIQLNGYYWDEEENKFNLYVVDYEPFNNMDIDPAIQEISMTYIKTIAEKAKRFYNQSNKIYATSEKAQEYYDLAKTLCNDNLVIEEMNIYVITTGFYVSNKPVDMAIKGIETVNVHVWDMERIFRLSEAEQGIKEFQLDFNAEYNTEITMLKVPEYPNMQNKIDCYIGMIPAKALAQMYDDLGPKLVERNVRSFLQARAGTNRGIRDTLKDESQKELFVAYNNGISSVAKSGEIESLSNGIVRINKLTNWQIVNGGQTTASIHQAYKSGVDLEGVYIQAKLTILNVPESLEGTDRYALEDEMIAKISEYANTQNKINKSDLLANTRFMSDLEKLSRTIWIPMADNRKEESKWYFERARGQYMVDIGRRKKGKEQNDFKKVYPKSNVLTKVEIAKYFMSWEGYPHISSKGGEEAFKRFMEANSQYWKQSNVTNDNGEVTGMMQQIDSDYYKRLIARRIINDFVLDIVNSMGLKGYRANVNYYTVSMFKHLYGDKIDLLAVWNNQSLDDKWTSVVRAIAENTIVYLRESAGEQNVTQWAKKEECWVKFKEEYSTVLINLV